MPARSLKTGSLPQDEWAVPAPVPRKNTPERGGVKYVVLFG